MVPLLRSDLISACLMLFLSLLNVTVAPKLLRAYHLGESKIFAHQLRLKFGAGATVLVKSGTFGHIVSCW